jgi:hypothetical protein
MLNKTVLSIGGKKMKFKKFISFIFIFTLITSSFIGLNTTKVSADGPAPPVTQFTILGYSWKNLYEYNNEGRYLNKSYASTYAVQDSTPYIVVYQMGYGKVLSPYNMQTIDSNPIVSNGVAIGFVKVISLAKLPTGVNNISLACNSYNKPWNTMRDSITLNIQPQSPTLTNSLISVNYKTSENINSIEDISYIKDIKDMKEIKDVKELKGIKFLDDVKNLNDLKNK